jgi:hypothetical protein
MNILFLMHYIRVSSVLTRVVCYDIVSIPYLPMKILTFVDLSQIENRKILI